MTPLNEKHEQLKGISVLTDAQDIQGYVCGARGEQGIAPMVLRPATTAEVATCVKHCVSSGISFIPQSGNTGLVGASVPDQTSRQIVISLERVKSVCKFDEANRTVTVSAGMRLSDVNAYLEEYGVFVPIDLGSDPMIGGMVSTNTGGGRYLRYGDMRRHVLGLTVVLRNEQADTVFLGSPVRKNNTGTDWKQIFIGTFGWYGVVTEAILNVEPAPQVQAAAIVVPSGHAAMLEILRYLETRLGPLLTAFEFMSGSSMRYALAHAPSVSNPFARGEIPDLALLVELSRTSVDAPWDTPVDDILQSALMEIWELPGAPIEDALFGRAEEIWALRHSLSEGVKSAGNLIAFDLGFARDNAIKFREQMLKKLPSEFPDIEICDFGHLGDGGLHFNLIKSGEAVTPDYERRLRDWVIERAVLDFGGSFSAEHGIGPKNRRYLEKYGQISPNVRSALAELLEQ